MNFKCNPKNDVIKTLNSVVTLSTVIFNNYNFCVFLTEMFLFHLKFAINIYYIRILD